jgi:L-glyceraldehyde 3-phosphate reductase
MWSLSLWVSKDPTASLDNRGVSVGVGDERSTFMPPFDVYSPDPNRYDGRMPYRRTGQNGLKLPAISLGFWHNFGDDKPIENQRAIMRRAFDLGITHFDLANNYGPPYGSAEINAGRVLREDFSELRDELVISSKAGWDMWPGPYGDLGSRKYILASLDQSLQRLGLDYVDIFYHHRPDPETPLAESMGALATAVQQGKALYVGISSYSPARTLEAARILADLGVPLLIHQPSYSMLNRWIEDGLLDALAEVGAGAITFSPLAQGMLTDRYVDGIPEGSRATEGKSLNPDSLVTGKTLDRIKGVAAIAKERGQSLAQMAIAWTLRDPRVTTSLVGASSAAQLEDSAGAVKNLDFSAAEVAAIDALAVDTPSIDLWRSQSRLG